MYTFTDFVRSCYRISDNRIEIEIASHALINLYITIIHEHGKTSTNVYHWRYTMYIRHIPYIKRLRTGNGSILCCPINLISLDTIDCIVFGFQRPGIGLPPLIYEVMLFSLDKRARNVVGNVLLLFLIANMDKTWNNHLLPMWQNGLV